MHLKSEVDFEKTLYWMWVWVYFQYIIKTCKNDS